MMRVEVAPAAFGSLTVQTDPRGRPVKVCVMVAETAGSMERLGLSTFTVTGVPLTSRTHSSVTVNGPTP